MESRRSLHNLSNDNKALWFIVAMVLAPARPSLAMKGWSLAVRVATEGAAREAAMIQRQILITTDDGRVLEGDLDIPEGAGGIVLFAHGSGSSRHSPRNRYVAVQLCGLGWRRCWSTCSRAEEEQAERWTGHLRFDIDLLAGRLLDATHWALQFEITRGLAIGYFGASTGAAAALVAAADEPDPIAAIVSRGAGRTSPV